MTLFPRICMFKTFWINLSVGHDLTWNNLRKIQGKLISLVNSENISGVNLLPCLKMSFSAHIMNFLRKKHQGKTPMLGFCNISSNQLLATKYCYLVKQSQALWLACYPNARLFVCKHKIMKRSIAKKVGTVEMFQVRKERWQCDYSWVRTSLPIMPTYSKKETYMSASL